MFALTLVACGGGGGGGSQSSGVSEPPPVTTEQFTVAVLPDTQCYTSGGAPSDPAICGGNGNMDMFNSQVSWIASNKSSQNIVAVVGLGDIVQCGDSAEQWTRARAAYDVIDNASLPYSAPMGNRDYDNSCATGGLSTRLSSRYNTYFGPAKFSGKPWYGASTFPGSANDNFYVTFSALGRQYLVLNLEFFARDTALAWASNVIDSHPQSDIIVVTNGFLNGQAQRMVDADPGGPAQYGLSGDRGNNGQEIWDKLLNAKPNVIAVLSSEAGDTQRRSDLGVNGNRVPQMQANFQSSGGGGYLRLLTFTPAQKSISVQTYSPFLKKFHTEAWHQFTVQYGK